MFWREETEPDWLHEAPFYIAALVAHGALLTLNPVIRWGSASRAEKVLPVEFVSEIPLMPKAPPPPPPIIGSALSKELPRRAPGEHEPAKKKAVAVDPPPKPTPKPAPAAAKAKTNKPGAGARMTKAPPQARPAEDARALRFAREAQVEAQRLRAQRARAAQDEAARAAAERAAAVKALAAERAAKQKAARARFAAEAQAARERRAAAARAESERRAEIAREAAERQALAEAERRRLAAEARASRARKRAELSSALATMANPDEELNASPASPAPSGRGSARKGRPAPGAAPAGEGSDEPLGARTAAAAALAESIDPGDAPGGGGGELLATSARGGGAGPEGGGVSWALEGSVGSRRLLSRVAPVSPDWVATRNLDLTVIVRFQVLPDGSVKSGAVIQKTSGFSDIDRRALESLRRWRFQPAKSGSEEWGRVSFRFTST